jgi:hypothetical protein
MGVVAGIIDRIGYPCEITVEVQTTCTFIPVVLFLPSTVPGARPVTSTEQSAVGHVLLRVVEFISSRHIPPQKLPK